MVLARPASSTQQLTYGQVEQLWINAGGSAALAPLMAAIATAESGRNPRSLNNTPSTGDYSVGLWQINYFDGMLASRTRQFGSPQQLMDDPSLQAKAAVTLYREQGLAAWSTYTSGAYKQYLNGSVPPDVNVPSSTPGSAQQVDASGNSTDCLINIPYLNACLLSKAQAKSILGVLTIGAGGVIGAIGVLILVGYGIARTRVTDKAAALVPAPVAKAVRASRPPKAKPKRPAAPGRARPRPAAPAKKAPAKTPLNQPIREKAPAKKAPAKKAPAKKSTEDTGLYEGGE
jgi:hypothetical protein